MTIYFLGELESPSLDIKPVEPTHKTREPWDNTSIDRMRYQKLVGKIIYLSHTKPDICDTVSFMSQLMHVSTNEYLKAVLRILTYLKAAPGHGLYFRRNEDRSIQVFIDADWHVQRQT